MRAALLFLPLLASCASSPSVAPVATYPAAYLHVVAVAPGDARVKPRGARWAVYLDGFIDSGASQRFASLVEHEKITDATVYFNSPGGHLVEAMALGRLLRERGFHTSVGARAADTGRPRAGACYSSCPFAYAGGTQRGLERGSALGLHRAENRVPVPDETAFQGAVAQQAGRYLAEMNVSQEMLAIMSRVPHDAIKVLTPAESVRLNLVNVLHEGE